MSGEVNMEDYQRGWQAGYNDAIDYDKDLSADYEGESNDFLQGYDAGNEAGYRDQHDDITEDDDQNGEDW